MTRPLTRTALLVACAVAAPLAVSRAQTTPAQPAPTRPATMPPTSTAPASTMPTSTQPAMASAMPSTGAHPDMTGTWELNIAASDFGGQGTPMKGTMVVTQKGDSITRVQTVNVEGSDRSTTMHHVLNAATTDTLTTPAGPLPFTSTTRWNDSVLVTDGKVMVQGMEIPIVSRYTVSPDGKKLMVDQVITTPAGEQTTHYVFDKKS